MQPLNLHSLRQSDCTQTKSLRSKYSSVQVLTLNTKCDEGTVTQDRCISEKWHSSVVRVHGQHISDYDSCAHHYIFSFASIHKSGLAKATDSEKIRREAKGAMSL